MQAPPTLSTKARTLASLGATLRHASIAPLAYFSAGDWQADADAVLAHLAAQFGVMEALAVRSSAHNEDLASASMAGHYASVLHVCGQAALRSAIGTVLASYGAGIEAQDEVLVQSMLTQVAMSGVAFSHDPGTGAPYRVINYTLGANTAAVTGGLGASRTFVASSCARQVPPEMAKILALLDELQALFPGRPLDIEFALAGPQQDLYLLQARPLLMQQSVADAQHHEQLQRVADKIRAAQQPHPFLRGRSTVFGIMPDWNPAEIIGIRPRPLALSLYRELVTDAIWAYQRNNYGYRNLRSFPLLVNFSGQPYIDVRLSFNSFVPKDVKGGLADRLVDYYMERLVAAPTLHDKIEFEIVLSCYTLDLSERMQVLAAAGFSENDRSQLSDCLRLLTNRIIAPDNGLWRDDAAKLNKLIARREEVLSSDLDPVSRIYWLLEDCKRYGTLPFAGLARAGFIAVQMLKSLVAVGVFTKNDYDSFMNGLNTVSSQLSRDLGSMERASFLSRYGHLRPGTYDILSPRYDEAPEKYFGGKQKRSKKAPEPRKPFRLSLPQMRTIAELLKQHGLSSDVVGLFEFLQAGIELREYAKFVFSRNLSDALSLFRVWGESQGYSEQDLSYANISCIRELYSGSDAPKTVLAQSIAEGKARYQETRQLWLPPLITKPDDVWSFLVPECEPNFITQASVTAAVVGPERRDRLAGAIVCIPSADPGYDWLFSNQIAGLVTAYGGVNSHMAIRANELGLAAVIGAGEALFTQWSQARRLHIDCAGRRVEVLS